MSVDIAILLAVTGAFIGIAGWLSGRDRRVGRDAEWRGGVNAKLDVIVGIKNDVEGLRGDIINHEGRLVAVESSAKQAHHMLDDHIKKEERI